MHYYQHNIADYRKDTGHLTLLEHGIYRQLLDSYYLDEKPIKTQVVIRRLGIKTDEEKSALNLVLEDFFTMSDGEEYYHHGRVDREITKYQERAETSRANGGKGGRPKKPKKTQGVILLNPDGTQTKANQEPLTNNQEPINQYIGGKAKRFQPPTLTEVKEYFLTNGCNNSQESERFMNFYESKGWMVGKNKMKNWKSSAANWISKNKPDSNNPSPARKTL